MTYLTPEENEKYEYEKKCRELLDLFQVLVEKIVANYKSPDIEDSVAVINAKQAIMDWLVNIGQS